MAKKEKDIVTSKWRSFVSIIKALEPLAKGIVKTDLNEIFLNMKDGTYKESFAVIHDNEMTSLYQWLCTDLDTMLGQLKDKKIQTKGVRIEDTDTEIKIYKDDVLEVTLTKLPILQDPSSSRLQAYKVYKKLPEYYEQLIHTPDKDWIPIEDNALEMLMDKKPISYTVIFNNVEQEVGSVDMMLSPSSFPMISKVNHMDVCLLKADRVNEKYYIGIREEYSSFTLYSIIAIMMVDDD